MFQERGTKDLSGYPTGPRILVIRLVLEGLTKPALQRGKEAPCDQLSASGLFGGPEALWQPGDPASFAGNQHQPSRP